MWFTNKPPYRTPEWYLKHFNWRPFLYTSARNRELRHFQKIGKNWFVCIFFFFFFFTFSVSESVDTFFKNLWYICMMKNKKKTDCFIRPQFLKKRPPTRAWPSPWNFSGSATGIYQYLTWGVLTNYMTPFWRWGEYLKYDKIWREGGLGLKIAIFGMISLKIKVCSLSPSKRDHF